MSLDAAGVSSKAEAALKQYDASKAGSDNFNFGPVYAELANNTSKQENQAERQALNDTVHKHLPDCTIIDMVADKNIKSVLVYNGKTHHLQVRNVDNYSELQEDYDVSKVLTAKKLTNEQYVALLNEQADKRFDKNADTTSQPKGENSPETKPAATGEYTIKAHDTLWKIASRSLMEERGQDKKGELTHDQIRTRINQIMELNKSGATAIHNADRIYVGHKLIMPGKTVEQKTNGSNASNDSNASSNSNASNDSNNQTQCGDAGEFDKCQDEPQQKTQPEKTKAGQDPFVKMLTPKPIDIFAKPGSTEEEP